MTDSYNQLKGESKVTSKRFHGAPLTKIATPVIRSAVGIKDVAYPKALGIEKLGRPWGISPT